jgi:hypothetical protein
MLEKKMGYATTISTAFDAKLMAPTTRKKSHQISFQFSFHGTCRKYGKHQKYQEMKVTFV